MERIIELKALENYQLYVRFEDGTEGTVDLSHLLEFEVFSPWKNYDFFKSVHVGGMTGVPTWNEELDIDRLNIYLQLKGISFEEYARLNDKKSAA